MNLERFLEEVEKVKNWYTLEDMLRWGNKYQCPITTVCENLTGKFYENIEYKKAGELLGLNVDIAKQIQEASDSIFVNKDLRKKLMKRMGLK